jgi:hypothetical protein
MRIKFIIGAIVLITVIIINACENKQAVVPAVVIASSCDTSNLTYNSGSNTMVAIINVQCGVGNTNCHAPGGYSGIYSNYQNGDLNGALFGSLPHMPLQNQPGWDPSCMLPKFQAWMKRGCPQ